MTSLSTWHHFKN